MDFLKQVVLAASSASIGGLIVEGFRVFLLPRLSAWRAGSVPRLKGVWRYEGGTLVIRQRGTRIKAEALRLGPGDTARRFDYDGRLMGGQLVLTWKQEGGDGHIVGAMVLRITGNGQELEGMTTYVAHDEGKVRSSPRKYTRTQ